MGRCLLLAGCVCLLACGDLLGPGGAEVPVRLTSEGVAARNRTSSDVFYFVIEREAAAYTDWIGCTRPDGCGGLWKIAPDATITIPYANVIGWPGSHEVIFYWWHLLPTGDGSWRADSMRAVVASP